MTPSVSLQPGLELLEAREVPSATLFTDGALRIVQTEGSDFAEVRMASGRIVVNDNGAISRYNPALVTQIVYIGLGGHDQFYNRTGVASSVDGGTGNDTLVGGWGTDILGGGWGEDTIRGGAGIDYLYGDGDNDKLYGDSGWDMLRGGEGNDRLDGGVGNFDHLEGEGGVDTFVQDWAHRGIWPFRKGFNRDAPVDFNGYDDMIIKRP